MMHRPALSLVAVAIVVSHLSGQEPAFEVASVKLAESRGGGWQFSPPGQVKINNESLGYVIALAFDVPWKLWRHQFVMGPAAYALKLPEYPRVNIQARGNPSNDPRAMLRTLLRERFGLRMHREMREVSVYALTVKQPGRLGRWLQPSPHNCREFIARGGKRGDADSPRKGDIEICWPVVNRGLIERDSELVLMSAGTIRDLILRIQGVVDRPIVDATGLSGNFKWELAGGMFPDPDSLFSMFEEQLGLRFERRTAPYEVFVIDDVRMPTPN